MVSRSDCYIASIPLKSRFQNPVDWISDWLKPFRLGSRITSKTLLPLRGTGVLNLASIRHESCSDIYSSSGTGSHVQRTHPDNLFPIYNQVMTRADSCHFDSPAERCCFEDVACVSGNRFI